MKGKWRSKGFIVSSIVFVAILIIVAFLKVGIDAPASGDTTSKTDHSTSTDQGSVAFTPGFDKTPAEALCKTDHYIDSSSRTVLAGDVEHRQFATAVSIPYKGTTDAAVSTETSAENCGNPTELGMIVDDMMLWTAPGAEQNKAWVGKIQTDFRTNGLDSFSGKNAAGEKVVSAKFQKYAGWINAVLLRFNTDGKQSLTSVRNWEVPAMADPSKQPVAVQATTQESKPAWVRTLKDKNGTCLYKIGFNALDKRIETFNCVTPTPVCTANCSSSTPKCTSNCGGHPECTVNCKPHVCPPSMPHGTWPVCKDDPSKAPNSSIGNGLSHDATPTEPAPTPTQPPSTPRVNPTPPAPAPVATPDPAPAPSPEPSAPAPSAPATGCSPAPGMTTC